MLYTDLYIDDALNARINPDIQSLAIDIANQGIQRPIEYQMRDGKAFVIDGHRRLLACRFLAEGNTVWPGFPEVPVDLLPPEVDPIKRIMLGMHQRQFGNEDTALLVAGLRKSGISRKDVATRLGMKAVESVANAEKLATMLGVPAVRDKIVSGEIPASAAVEALRVFTSPKAAADFIGELKGEQTKASVKRKLDKIDPRTRKGPAAAGRTVKTWDQKLAGYLDNMWNDLDPGQQKKMLTLLHDWKYVEENDDDDDDE